MRVVHRNQSDNRRNWSDTLPSADATAKAVLVNTLILSPSRTHTPILSFCLCLSLSPALVFLWVFVVVKNRSGKITAGMSD